MEAAAAERWSIARLLIHAPTARKLQDVPLQRITNAINADAAIQEWIKQGTEPETVELMEHDAARRPRLKRPKSRRELDDGFYRRVADAYRGAVANGLPPAKTLAADSETPPGTVNRWIARARNAGLSGRSRAGKGDDLMPTLTITTRRATDGPRYVVRYRLGGRAYPIAHAGSFRTLKEAKARRDFVAGELAAGRNPRGGAPCALGGSRGRS